METKPEGLEFSRTFEVAALNGLRTEATLAASEAECAALARRFDVEGIANFTAEVVLSPFASGNKVAVKARFGADVRQACVVTLEPVNSRVTGDIVAEFVPSAFIHEGGEIEFDPGDDDAPEPIVDGRIEVGELIAQHLGLEIDPFPRAPGVEFQGLRLEDDGAQVSRPNPFAVLEKLKTSKG